MLTYFENHEIKWNDFVANPIIYFFVCENAEFWVEWASFAGTFDLILILKKSAAEAHPLLLETYGEADLSERIRREWFQKFKNNEFDIEEKECSGKPKVYEDTEWEALLNRDSCQMQEEPYDGQYFK